MLMDDKQNSITSGKEITLMALKCISNIISWQIQTSEAMIKLGYMHINHILTFIIKGVMVWIYSVSILVVSYRSLSSGSGSVLKNKIEKPVYIKFTGQYNEPFLFARTPNVC